MAVQLFQEFLSKFISALLFSHLSWNYFLKLAAIFCFLCTHSHAFLVDQWQTFFYISDTSSAILFQTIRFQFLYWFYFQRFLTQLNLNFLLLTYFLCEQPSMTLEVFLFLILIYSIFRVISSTILDLSGAFYFLN